MLTARTRSVRLWTILGVFVALFSTWASAADSIALNKYSISVNGADRIYYYFVSAKAASFRGNWVVFALHDNGQTATQAYTIVAK